MKSATGNLLAFLLCILLMPGTARALPKIVVGTVRGFPGHTVEVPVSLRFRTNDVRDIVALQADIRFDTAGLEDATAVQTSAADERVFDSSAPVAGTRRLLLYSPNAAALTNGEIARIPFRVAPNEFRNFNLQLTNVIFVRSDASVAVGEAVSGGIVVLPVFLTPGGFSDGYLEVTTNGAEQSFVIQATPDFATWVNVQTNSTDTSLLQFLDADAREYPRRFYRAIRRE